MNLDGQVVGINAQIISPNRTNAGIAFAIPINVAMDIQQSLRQDGVVRRGRLGVYFGSVTPELADAYGLSPPRGAVVNEVVPDSAADNAGVESADIILSLNGNQISEAGELPVFIGASSPGAAITMTILRDGEELEMIAVLDSLEDENTAAENILGLRLENLDNETKKSMGLANGVRVVEISQDAETPSDIRNRIRRGDVILGILVKRRMRLVPDLGRGHPGAGRRRRKRRHRPHHHPRRAPPSRPPSASGGKNAPVPIRNSGKIPNRRRNLI